MTKKSDTEAKLLGMDLIDYEKEIESEIDREIESARKEMKKRENPESSKVIITDIKNVSDEKKFDKGTIYRVFNRKQKTETFVNGEQAENMLRYSDDYVVRFDHRVEYN